MVKLSALLAEAEKSGNVYYAVEYFPPRTPEGLTKLYERVGRITSQGPLYSDVTWGAGGGTSDLTLEMCTRLKKEFGTEPNMHLTWCVCARSVGFALSPSLYRLSRQSLSLFSPLSHAARTWRSPR